MKPSFRRKSRPLRKLSSKEERTHGGQDLLGLSESCAITSEKLEQAVKQLEDRLQDKPKDKPLKKAVRALRMDLLPRLQKPPT